MENRISVGTRTAGSTSETSASIIMRKNAAAAPGLRLRRMCVTNQSQNSGSFAMVGASDRIIPSRKSRSPQCSRTPRRVSPHSASVGAHG